MRNEKIKKIAFAGIIMALIIVMTFTNLGFIILPSSVSITLVHIPVLIGSMILGKKYGALLGFVFGLCSFILSFYN
ncbi:MAG: ECF transporter S component, partial [Bacilli bacterium]|nr:ECF transporter S component [Bacilli bacterium]